MTFIRLPSRPHFPFCRTVEFYMTQISFHLKAIPPFRLDLTAWVLRRRDHNLWDRWDGQIYRRILVLQDKPVEVAVVCQQFTLTSGIRMLNRLVSTCGVALSGSQVSGHAFPRPADLAGLKMDTLRNLGFGRQKAGALIDFACMVTEGSLDLERLESMNDEGALEKLKRLRAVGRRTAEYILLQGLGCLHVFPGDDVGVRNRLQRRLC
jgi:3-methyladenine DNA glycosylase/8-oxoguanine DNA glycosylase